MDHSRFDALVRSWATVLGTRRQALATGIVGAGLLHAVGLIDGSAKKKHKHKKKKCAKTGQATSKKRKKCCKGLTRDEDGVCLRSGDCIPTTCGPTDCGKVPDGCGGTLDCRCSGDAICVDGECQPCDVCLDGCIFDTVQAAINAASAGETIRICPGAYKEKLIIDRNLTLIGAGDGNGAGNTILQGGGPGLVVFVPDSKSVTLEHVRVTGGTLGGIQTGLGAKLALIACTITGNATTNSGGGIQVFGDTLTLTDCRITGNRADQNGGGIFNDFGTVTLDAASRVTGNTSDTSNPDSGGGIFNQSFGTVILASALNVTGNFPDNCNDDAVPLCEDGA